MSDYRPLMRELAQDYEFFSDIPASLLIKPAMAWFEEQDDDRACQALTEARQPTFLKVWRHHLPRAGYELAALRANEHSTFMDAAADLAISISLAIVEWCMPDLLGAFDEGREALAPPCSDEEADDRIERARDMQREVA